MPRQSALGGSPPRARPSACRALPGRRPGRARDGRPGEANLVVVRRTDFWIEVEIRTDILFPSGSAQLAPSAVTVIERLAQVLAPLPNAIRVEGYTDNVPIRNAAFYSNWELSAARAGSVVRVLSGARRRSRPAGGGRLRRAAPDAEQRHARRAQRQPPRRGRDPQGGPGASERSAQHAAHPDRIAGRPSRHGCTHGRIVRRSAGERLARRGDAGTAARCCIAGRGTACRRAPCDMSEPWHASCTCNR